MAETPYKIKDGKVTEKVKASAVGGLTGLPIGVVTAYYISVLLPDVPTNVQLAMNLIVVAVVTWVFTQGPALAAAWLKRPSPRDVPVPDPPKTVEPLPPPVD